MQQCPRLDEMLLQAMADKHHLQPALDELPTEYVGAVVALLDPEALPVERAARFVRAPQYWRRRAEARWKVCRPEEHGRDWKRLFLERHAEEAIGGFVPSKGGVTLRGLRDTLRACRPYVTRLRLEELPSHANLWELLGDFPLLSSLSVTYRAKRLAMDYDKSLYGLTDDDVSAVGTLVQNTRTLVHLALPECRLGDSQAARLCEALARNDTVTELDLSRNRLGDAACEALAGLVGGGASALQTLALADNRAHEAGAAALAAALGGSEVRALDLGMNPIGDRGAAAVASAAAAAGVERLGLASTGAGEAATAALAAALPGSQVRALDVSGNGDAFGRGGALEEAAAAAPRLVRFSAHGTAADGSEGVRRAVRLHRRGEQQ